MASRLTVAALKKRRRDTSPFGRDRHRRHTVLAERAEGHLDRASWNMPFHTSILMLYADGWTCAIGNNVLSVLIDFR